jgi:hypothetical protein
MTTVIAGYDCMGSNVDKLPAGQAAGYSTGSDGIPWTQEQANTRDKPYPLIWIDQSPTVEAIELTADVYDIETGAVTPAQIPGIITQARQNYNDAKRPGQRWPAVYCNQSTLTTVANELVAAKLTDVPIWLAVPGRSYADASAQITGASGPFPVIGQQYAWDTYYDFDLWSMEWLATVSHVVKPAPEPTPDPKPVTPSPSITKLPGGYWEFPVTLIGRGIDGNMWTVVYTSGTTASDPVKV